MDDPAALLEALPPGPRRDELLRLVRIGQAFKAQQCGRRQGFLARYVGELVAKLEHRTFEALLVELEYQAACRAIDGASPIERVSRDLEIVVFHDPKHGRQTVTFKTVRNKSKLRDPGNR